MEEFEWLIYKMVVSTRSFMLGCLIVYENYMYQCAKGLHVELLCTFPSYAIILIKSL